MTYSESIEWLFKQFPMYQQVGKKAYKPDLSNTIALCDALGLSPEKLRCIHVAGTNGKGSTSNYLASILMESGERVGLFTSPHIVDFRERIRCNGEMISEEEVVDFCRRVQALQMPIAPSFFEVTWCMALSFFFQRDCTVSVIETGLGGRLDATNIVRPVLSIITNIGLDHRDLLGDTRTQIAAEKAGIIKPETPVLIGERDPETAIVFQKTAASMEASIYFSDEFGVDSFVLPEGYPQTNERTVRAAVELLNQVDFSIAAEAVREGLRKVGENTGFFGRFQVMHTAPLTVVDVAHNQEGIQSMLMTLAPVRQGRLVVLYGTSADKDFRSILSLFPRDTIFVFTEFSNPRSARIDQLQPIAADLGLQATFFKNFSDAHRYAQQIVNKEDTLLITGSFFLVSDFF